MKYPVPKVPLYGHILPSPPEAIVILESVVSLPQRVVTPVITRVVALTLETKTMEKIKKKNKTRGIAFLVAIPVFSTFPLKQWTKNSYCHYL